MQRPAKGFTYHYGKHDITLLNKQEQADFRLHRIGFVFQSNNLLAGLSIQENVMLPHFVCNGKEGTEDYANEMIAYVGLSHLKKHYPHQLSGGEKKRGAIARALVNDADIILADEPTASLDETNTQTVLNLLRRLAHERGKTVIIVSHDAAIAQRADVLYRIQDKKIELERALIQKTEQLSEQKKNKVK